MNRRQLVGLVVTVLIVGTVGFGAATAQSEGSGDVISNKENAVTVNTTYPVNSNSEAVGVKVVVEPRQDRITDVYLNISRAATSSGPLGFIDLTSFSRTEIPSGAVPSVSESVSTYRTEQQKKLIKSYHISELEPGERIEITFDAYPTRLQPATLDVAMVQYQYVQNGQRVPGASPGLITATVDLSSSPVDKLADARATIDELEQSIWINKAVLPIGVAVFFVGIGVAFYAVRLVRSQDDVDRSRLVSTLEDLKYRVTGDNNEAAVQEVIEKYRTEEPTGLDNDTADTDEESPDTEIYDD